MVHKTYAFMTNQIKPETFEIHAAFYLEKQTRRLKEWIYDKDRREVQLIKAKMSP